MDAGLSQNSQLSQGLSAHSTVEGDATQDDLTTLAADTVSLSAKATVTDGDGDTADTTYSVDLGGNISFADDEPSITANMAVTPVALGTDDTLTIDAASHSNEANFESAFWAAAEEDADFGADSQGSIQISDYALSLGQHHARAGYAGAIQRQRPGNTPAGASSRIRNRSGSAPGPARQPTRRSALLLPGAKAVRKM